MAKIKWKPKTKRAAPHGGSRLKVRTMTPEELEAMRGHTAGSWVDRTGRVK